MESKSQRPAALQDRSARTQDLLCDAAEALLREGGLARCTIQEVAARSGRSPGSVYRRFGDKDGMIEAVIERFLERAIAGRDARLKSLAKRYPDLSSRLKALVNSAIEARRREGHLVEALREAAATSQNANLRTGFERARRASLDTLKQMFKDCAPEIARPDKERAIEFAMTMFAAAVRSPEIDDRVLRAELPVLLMNYLTLGRIERK